LLDNGDKRFNLMTNGLLSNKEAHLSFAGISRQMKDLNFSATSASLW
jgi:hypothetical protein